MAERPIEPVRTEDVLDVTGEVTREQIDRAVADADLDVGVFTDEELHWLADRDEVYDDPIEAPRLRELSPGERKAALDAALWMMFARGDVGEGDDGEFYPTGRHGLLPELREESSGVARVEISLPDDEPEFGALYTVGLSAVMVEEVSPLGLHNFTITTPARAATILLALVAPDGVPGDTEEPRKARAIEEFSELSALVADASRSVRVMTGRPDGEVFAGTLSTLYLLEDGLYLLSGWTGPGDGGEVTLQRIGESDATAWAAWVVTEAMVTRT